MKAPAFWWEPRPAWTARLLSPLGLVYGAVAGRRMRRPGAAAPVPVICVGNFTAGGAGKTPVALALGRLLCAAGEVPAFLSRGYGGRPGRAPHRVDPARDPAGLVGDEPLLLAACATTFVSADRIAGAAACAAEGATSILLDDGLQNPSLRKSLALAVVDGAVGTGNGLCIPAGPLRAPLAAQWALVDAVVVIGEGAAGARIAGEARSRGKPVFAAQIVPRAGSQPLAGRRLFAFAGIGRPEKFYATLRSLGAELVGTRDFPDHHRYEAREMAQIRAEALRLGATPITTEKDLVRLPQAKGIEALGIDLRFEEPAALQRYLLDRIRA